MIQFFNKFLISMNVKIAIPALFPLCILWSCATQSNKIAPSIINTLKEYKNSSELAGTLIYEGSVYPLGPTESEQVFAYERRVKVSNGITTATHITHDAGRNLVVIQSARYSSNFAFLEFESTNAQTGIRTKVVQDGKILKYLVTERSGKIIHAEEDVRDPVAVGPTLFGLISSQWDELTNGSSFYLQFVVAEMKQSYRFEVRMIENTKLVTRFEMKPTNRLIGLFLSPFIFDFDSSKKSILTYTGRVPPMRTIDGKFKNLDARVVYTHLSTYR